MADLDSLNLKIESESRSATSSIDRTTNALRRLHKALGAMGNAGIGIERVSVAVGKLEQSVSGISSTKIEDLKSMSSALRSLRKSVESLSSMKNVDFSNLKRSLSGISHALRSLNASDVARLRDLGDAMRGLKDIGTVNLSGVSRSVERVSSAGRSSSHNFDIIKNSLKGISGDLNSVSTGFRKLASVAKTVGKTIHSAMKSAASIIRSVGSSISSAMKSVRNSIKLSDTALGKFLQKFASRAVSMAMRAMIKAITTAFKEGLENLYNYSSEVRTTMDALATSVSGLKAAAGSSLYSVLSSISGVLMQIIGYATDALNALSQLFSAMGGKTTYYKGITDDAKAYDDQTKKATSSTKKLKSALMGFDEINKLPDESSSGSSGNKGKQTYAGTFTKDEIDATLLDAVKRADFTRVSAQIGKKINEALSNIPWAKIRRSLSNISQSLSTALNSLFKTVKPDLLGRSISRMFNYALKAINDFWKDTDWKMIGKWVSNMLGAAFDDIDAEEIGMFLVRKIRAAIQYMTGLFSGNMSWDKLEKTLKGMMRGAIEGMSDIDLPGLAKNIIKSLGNGINMVANLIRSGEFKRIWFGIIDGLIEVFQNLPPMGDVFINLVSSLWELLEDTIGRFFPGNGKSSAFNTLMDSVINGIASIDFSKIGKLVGDGVNVALNTIPWDRMRKSLILASKSLVTFINGLFNTVKPEKMGKSLSNLFNSAMMSINQFWQNTDWESIGTWVSDVLSTSFENINGEQIGMFLVRKIRAILKFVTGLFKGDMSFEKIGNVLRGMLRGALTAMSDLDIPGLANNIFTALGNCIRMVTNLIRSEEFHEVLYKIIDNIVAVFNNLPPLGDVFVGLATSLWDLLKDTVNHYFGTEGNDDGFSNLLDAIIRGVKGSIQKAKAWLKSSDSSKFIDDLGEGIGQVLTTAFEAVKVSAKIFKDIALDLWGLLKTAIIKLFGGDTSDESFDNVGDSIATGIKNAITGAVQWLRSEDGQKRVKEIGTRISMLFENLKIAAGTFVKFAGKIFGAVLEALNEEFSLDERLQSIKDTITTGVMSALESLGATDDEGNVDLPKLVLTIGEIALIGITAVKLFKAIGAAIGVALAAMGAAAGSVGSLFTGGNFVFAITGLIAAIEFAKITIDIAEDIEAGIDITHDQIAGLLASALTVASSILFIAGNPVPGAVCLSLAAIFEIDSILWKVKRDPRNTAEIVRNAMRESGGEDAAIDVAVELNTRVSGFTEVKGDVQEIVDKFNELTGLNFDHSQMVQFLKDCHVLADGTEDSVSDLAIAIQDVFAVNAWNKLGDVAVTNNLKEIGKMANLTDEQVETLISTMLGLKDLNLTGEVDVDTEEFDFHMKGAIAWMETYARKIGDTDGKEIDNTVKINGVQTAINNLQSVYNSVPDTKTISVGVQYKAGGFGSYAYNAKKLFGYASGGFVSKGEVFIAGESGSELIGQINGRSAVANKAEIGDAIFRYMDAHDSRSNNGLSAESIAGAVVGAIKSTGLGAVYLDGKQLAASIRSESKRIGHSAV